MRERQAQVFLSEHAVISVAVPGFDFEPPSSWIEVDPNMQIGGTSQGFAWLSSFFDARGQQYYRQLSSPVTSADACSRLSPYLAWGNLSLRQVYQELLKHWQKPGWRRSLVALSSRLHWHCYFI